MKYRKKPVVIDAWPVHYVIHALEADRGHPKQEPSLEDAYCRGDLRLNYPGNGEKPTLLVGTLEGVMKAQYDGMLIQGVKGEFYPCDKDIFQATYEPE